MNRKHCRRSSIVESATRNVIDQLEARRLLAVFTITGTGGDDNIRLQVVGANYEYRINADAPVAVNTGLVDGWVINGGAGKDTIEFYDLLSNDPATVNGGAGEDNIWLDDAPSSNLDDIDGAVTVDGGSEVDRILLRDSSQSFSDTYTITSTTVSRPSFGGVTFNASVEQIELQAQQGNNAINVQWVAATTRLAVYGNGGNDTFVMGTGDIDATVALGSRTTILGGGGSDSLIINDSTDLAPSILWHESAVTRFYDSGNVENAGSLLQDGIELYRYNGSNQVERFDMNQSQGGVSYELNMGGGDDLVRVTEPFGNLEFLDGNVKVNGDAGTDLVELWDDFSGQTDDYTWTGSELSHPATATFSVGSSTEQINLTAPAGNNNFFMQVIPTGQGWYIEGNEGEDSLWLANNTGNVGNIDGAVTFGGGNGTDRLYFDDDNNASNESYTISAGSITRSGGPASLPNVPVTHSFVDEVYVFSPQGNNTFNLNSITQNVRYELYGNDGNDVFNLGNDLDGNFPLNTIAGQTIFLNGQGGTDTVNINDSADNLTDGASAGADYYRLDANKLVKYSGFGGLATTTDLNFSTHEFLNLTGANHVNVIDVNQTLAGISTNIDLADGNDTATVSFDAKNLNTIQGALTVNGGGGPDAIVTYDRNNPAASTYTIEATSLARPGMTPITLQFADSVIVEGNNLPNIFNVNSTVLLPANQLTINALNGNDRLNVTNPSGNANNASAGMTFNGGNDSDSIFVYDDVTVINSSYEITNAKVRRTQSGLMKDLVTYATTESVTLNASDGANTINVISTAATTPVVVNANDGNDTIRVGGNDLDSNILGALSINAGGNFDTIIADDVDDTTADFGLSEYRVDTGNVFGFRKVNGVGGVSSTFALVEANGYESFQLNHANSGGNTRFLSGNAIPITVFGGSGDDVLFVGAAADLSQHTGAILFSGAGGTGDRANFVDTGRALAATYSISSSGVGATGMGSFTYDTVEQIQIFCTPQSNIVNIGQAGAAVTINGGNGNDVVNLSPANFNLDLIDNPVFFIGDTGDDAVNAYDGFTSYAGGYTVDTDRIVNRAGFGGVTWDSVRDVYLGVADGGNIVNLRGSAAGARVSLEGGDGNDRFDINTNSRDLATLGLVTVAGGNGTDTVQLFDDGAIAGSTYFVGNSSISRSSTPTTVTYSSIDRVDLQGSQGPDTFVHDTTATTLRWFHFGNGGADVFNIASSVTPGGGSLLGAPEISSGAGLDQVNINTDNTGIASAVMSGFNDLVSIAIGNGGYLGTSPSAGAMAITTQSLIINSSGQWDLNDNAAVVDYAGSSPITAYEQYIRDGRLRKGVNNTLSTDPAAQIGSAEATDLFAAFPASFLGTPVDSTSVLLRYTRQGDANLDRVVNFDDLLRLASNYNGLAKRWSQGNFNYDSVGATNFDDLLILASNYNQSLASHPLGSLHSPPVAGGSESSGNEDEPGAAPLEDVLA